MYEFHQITNVLINLKYITANNNLKSFDRINIALKGPQVQVSFIIGQNC